MDINCPVYQGSAGLVSDLQGLIQQHPAYSDMFVAVIVHGSFGSDEVIRYSDFDGLLVVKDTYRDTPILRQFLRESMHLVYRFDPLQHHGWFIVYDSQIQDWPMTYFPPELFAFSKVIFPQSDLKCSLRYKTGYNYQRSLEVLLTGFERKMATNYRPRNLYQLKGLLSEVMLLPTLYYQAKYRKAIFKKFSFELVKPDFSEAAWQAIELSSNFRKEWEYELNIVQRFLVRRSGTFFRKLAKHFLAPQIPKDWAARLDELLQEALPRLVLEARNDLQTFTQPDDAEVH